MKKLLLALIIFPALAFAQDKNDTKIIVAVKDTTNLINRLSVVLYERGYDLHTKDGAAGFISTEEKEFKYWVIKGRFLVKGKTLVITGEVAIWDLNATRRLDFDPMEYRSGILNTHKPAWEELEEIGRQFGTLSYGR